MNRCQVPGKRRKKKESREGGETRTETTLRTSKLRPKAGNGKSIWRQGSEAKRGQCSGVGCQVSGKELGRVSSHELAVIGPKKRGQGSPKREVTSHE